MTLGPRLRRVLLIDRVKGLKVGFNYQKPTEAAMEQYPPGAPSSTNAIAGSCG